MDTKSASPTSRTERSQGNRKIMEVPASFCDLELSQRLKSLEAEVASTSMSFHEKFRRREGEDR